MYFTTRLSEIQGRVTYYHIYVRDEDILFLSLYHREVDKLYDVLK